MGMTDKQRGIRTESVLSLFVYLRIISLRIRNHVQKILMDAGIIVKLRMKSKS